MIFNSQKGKWVKKGSPIRATGDSYESVTNILGKPTFDQPFVKNKSTGIASRSLKYYAVIWESGVANESYDELVDVSLDDQGRVRSVHIRVTLE